MARVGPQRHRGGGEPQGPVSLRLARLCR